MACGGGNDDVRKIGVINNHTSRSINHSTKPHQTVSPLFKGIKQNWLRMMSVRMQTRRPF